MSTIDSLLLGDPSELAKDTTLGDQPTAKRDTWMRLLMGSVHGAVQVSNQVPSGSDFDYFTSTDMAFRNEAADVKADILHLLHRISAFTSEGNDNGADSERGIDLDDFEYADLQVLVEGLLESADLRLDAIKSTLQGDKTDQTDNVVSKSNSQGIRVRDDASTIDTMPKPQDSFAAAIDNHRHSPFRPMLSTKPHAHSRAPLDLRELPNPKSIVPREEEDRSGNDMGDDEGEGPSSFYAHPYELELKTLRYPAGQMTDASSLVAANNSAVATKEIARLSNSHNHPYEFIDTAESLARAIEEMGAYTELAVDVEHHSVRSFQGITCLLQISTRSKDYIIDTLALRSLRASSIASSAKAPNASKRGNTQAHSPLQTLNEVFCDPGIVKVFHGCARDILWLQCDCGVYVVNCFDTYQAAVELQLQGLSLAFLLQSYCRITAQKQYQQADWRQRPLRKELVSYARDDTHYLLFIYDCLRRDIWGKLGKDAYQAVLDRSRETCLSRYEKPRFFPLGYRALLKRGLGSARVSTLNITKETALSALWAWRDEKARLTDESLTYVLSTSEIMKIAMATPMTPAALRALFPSGNQRVLKYEDEIICLMNAELSVSAGARVASQAGKMRLDSGASKHHTETVDIHPNTPNSVFTFQPGISKGGVITKSIFSDMSNPRASKSWFALPADASTLSIPRNNPSNKQAHINKIESFARDAYALIERARQVILSRVKSLGYQDQHKVDVHDAGQPSVAKPKFPNASQIDREVSRGLSVQEAADLAAMPAIVVEDVLDDNRKRKSDAMEVPLESQGHAKLVNLKKLKKNNKVDKQHSHATAVQKQLQPSEVSVCGIGNVPVDILNAGYSRVSEESISLLNAAGLNNAGLETKRSRGEKEKEKKRKEKEMKKSFDSGESGGKGGASAKKAAPNPYFAQAGQDAKEKVPERDHNRFFTY